jgi:putative tryptophan/tyrosine transport system substrate-binding protein
VHADKILGGAQIADVPVEQAIQFELVINLRPASALGIKIPASIHLRVDKVIE